MYKVIQIVPNIIFFNNNGVWDSMNVSPKQIYSYDDLMFDILLLFLLFTYCSPFAVIKIWHDQGNAKGTNTLIQTGALKQCLNENPKRHIKHALCLRLMAGTHASLLLSHKNM